MKKTILLIILSLFAAFVNAVTITSFDTNSKESPKLAKFKAEKEIKLFSQESIEKTNPNTRNNKLKVKLINLEPKKSNNLLAHVKIRQCALDKNKKVSCDQNIVATSLMQNNVMQNDGLKILIKKPPNGNLFIDGRNTGAIKN